MFIYLLFLFVTIPIVELYILMRLGSVFGIGTTLFIVLGTGFLGAYLAKREGYRVLFKIQSELNTGRLPARELIDGVMIFVAGVVLLTPGLLTDIAGFVLLFPVTRYYIREKLIESFKKNLTPKQRGGDGTIEAEFYIDE